MKISILETGNFMLDGGAMFGVIPKVLWSKWYPSDERNLCNLSLRCLLVETGDQKIIVDTGLGNKQDAKFFSYYYRNGASTLAHSLALAGLRASDITAVVHTHLHLDHCGGSVQRSETGQLELAFPDATHYVSRAQWEWMLHPNPIERPSFLSENIDPISTSGKLKLLEHETELFPGFSLRLFHGHTAGLLVPEVSMNGKRMVFVSDLVPLMAQVPLSWICSYDTSPLQTFKEKERFLNEACSKGIYLLFQHDLFHHACSLRQTEKGIRTEKEYTFAELGLQHWE